MGPKICFLVASGMKKRECGLLKPGAFELIATEWRFLRRKPPPMIFNEL